MTTRRTKRAPGVLLVFHRPTRGQFTDAGNVLENITAFGQHSRFRVWEHNTDLGTPESIDRLEFDAIVVHYSVFMPRPVEGYLLDQRLLAHIERSRAYKVATFQDEHHYCRMRFDFIDRYGVDCVFTMLEQPDADRVYAENTAATRTVSNLPAYVGDDVLASARQYRRADDDRDLDLGYRGRPMPAYMGRGAQEKREIGERFAELAAGSGLTIDIGVREEDRLYGADWHQFVARSRATLGVESGASCFDLRDEVREEYERLSRDGHEVTLEELERGALGRWDWKIPYQTVSPRNFEAAAYRVLQVLYEGRYGGVLEPGRHYLALKKDFSNLDEVIAGITDPSTRQSLVDNAYEDLIASGEYGYERLISAFDRVLADAGLSPAGRARGLTVGSALTPPIGERIADRRRSAIPNFAARFPRTWSATLTLGRPVTVPTKRAARAIRRRLRG